MVSFIILLIVRTARIVCADRETDRHTQTHRTATVILAAHAHRGLKQVFIVLYVVVFDLKPHESFLLCILL